MNIFIYIYFNIEISWEAILRMLSNKYNSNSIQLKSFALFAGHGWPAVPES